MRGDRLGGGKTTTNANFFLGIAVTAAVRPWKSVNSIRE